MPRAEIRGTTRIAAVIGNPAHHSKSPALHNAGFVEAGIDAVYLAFDVTSENLGEAVRSLRLLGCIGASVTVPHKTAVIDFCDEMSPTADAIGAVNTLEFRDDGSIVGHNTDALGYVRAFEESSGASFAGARVVILGAGGAARAVDAGVREAGASHVTVVARTPSKVHWADAHPWIAIGLEKLLERCDILIDCTSLALSEEREADAPCPIPVASLPSAAIVSSLVYHRKPALLAEAEARGLKTVDGAGMLLHQGAIAFALWTGAEAPLEAMRAGLAAG